MATFTVDTHLFRELGELLVGRDSTALVELIKNAYDADASHVIVSAVHLSDGAKGVIEVTDDGTGMTFRDFEKGFLRIASRTKDTRIRRSKVYRRRYTGQKGIGRLAAHKLARIVEVSSVAADEGQWKPGVEARIDWDEVENYETLAELDEGTAVVAEEIEADDEPGTTVRLSRLRRRWTETQRARFVAEVQGFQPPSSIIEPLPKALVSSRLIFQRPTLRDVRGIDPGFRVELQGDFEAGEAYWANLAEAANWIIEIDSNASRVRYVISPSLKTRQSQPLAKRGEYEVEQDGGDDAPVFQARILIREGPLGGGSAFRTWAQQSAGVRVYMEGFRVLPYGEPRNDWLGLDADYTRRARGLPWLSEAFSENAIKDEGLNVLPNVNYFGGVFLTERSNPELRVLVNREGFVPDRSYEILVRHVRTGIDLSTRLRAVASEERRTTRKAVRSKRPDPERRPSEAIERAFDEGLREARAARAALAAQNYRTATARLEKAVAAVEHAQALSQDLISEGSMLRVLASVGTQMSALTHEMNALLGSAEALERSLGELRQDESIGRAPRARLGRLLRQATELRRGLERQAAYLIDVVSLDARRRRRRMPLGDRFDAASRLVSPSADRRGIQILNEIPPELKSPPMFPAELTTVFSNLLTNAVKAAGRRGKVRARGHSRDGSTVVIVENTGKRVSLRNSERWFQPFESTTTNVDVALGQGMGLGLPITRSLLEEYGAEVRFVQPRRGYSTALELRFS